MASVLARKKLLDIAQGMGKKKDEDELRKEQFAPKDDAQVRAAVQQSNREKALNQLKNSKLEKLAGASVNAGAQTAATAVNSYAQNRNDIQDLNTKIADTERYMQIKYPHIPVERTTWTHEGQKRNVSEDAREVRDYLRTLYNQRNSKQSAVDQMDQEMPSVGKEYDAVRNTLNSANKAAVNPYGDAKALRFDAAQLRGKAATYVPGSWQAEQRGKKDIEVASDLVYQAGVIEDPAKALEETNADIAELENMKQKASGGAYMGYSLKDIETALENAYKKRTLLEGKTYVPENAAPWRPARTDEDFLSGLDDNAMHALKQFGIPEGTTYADYDLDDWQDTIHLGSAEAVHDYYARKRVDPEGAAAWLDAMMPFINENRARKQVENTAELTERMPFTANVLATGANLLQPVGSLYTIAQQVTGQDVDPNSKWFGASRFAGAVRGTTENMIEEAAKKPAWEKVLKTTYKVGTSIADNAARMLLYRGIGIGGNAGTAAMAFGTYGDNVSQAIESGATQGEAALVGAVQAGLEYVTEVMPANTYMRLLDSKDAKGMRAIMHDVAEAVLGDGFGEAANSAISTAAENWIIENGGSIDEAADLYMFRGEAKDYEEAVRMAWKDAMGAALYEGMMGALSAGLLSGGIDAVHSGSAQVQKWLDNRKAAKQATQENTQTEQTEQAAPEAEAPAQEAPADEMGKVTLESMAQEMAAQSAPKPAAKVTVQTPQEYAAAQDLKEEAQKAKETKPVLSNGGAVVTRADNGYTVEKDGQNVNLEDLDAQSEEARMLNAAPDMTQDAANDMLSRYDEQGDADAQDYAKGYKAVYDAALNGKTLEDAQGLYADELTDAQRKSAYEMGVKARETEQANILRKTELYAAQAGMKVRQAVGTSGVSAESITRRLTDKEKITMQLLDRFGKRFDLQFRIYDTLDEGRSNATYIEGTNVINVALDAQKGALNRAASHEAFHYVEKFAKEDADKLKAFVLNKLRNMEEYDLDARIREKEAQYKAAGIENFDAESEIVADSMLDIIGTEENIRQMAQENPNLLSKIRDAVKRISDFLQEQLEALSLINKEAGALYGDKEYMDEVVRRMNKALENAKENRQAQQRVSQTAAMDTDVQAYLKDLSTAKDAQERANLLDSLTIQVYLRTQMDMIQKTGDYEGGMQPFKDALNDFAKGKGNLNTLLKDAGLDAAKNVQDTAVMAWLARERERVGNEYNEHEDGVLRSLNELDKKYGVQKENESIELAEEKATENKARVSKMGSVAHITGEEFAKGAVDLVTQVATYFDSVGNAAYNPTLGKVILDRRGVQEDMAHGIGRIKAASFAAVKAVIEKGLMVDYQQNWKGRGYDTAVIAAPVTIDKQMYLEGVIVIRSKKTNRFYVHEVLTMEKGAVPFKSASSNNARTGEAPSLVSILQEIKDVNGEKRSLKDAEDVQDMRDELRALVEEQKKLQQEQERYKATEEYKRVHEPFMAKEEGARKAYAEYLKRSGLGEVNKRMNEVRNMIFSLESKIANAELEAQVQKAEDPVRKAARLRNELSEKEMRLQEVTRKLDEMQQGKGYNDIVDAMMAGKANEDAYNQYLESSGMMKLAKEEKQLRAEIADAKRLLEEAQKQTEQQTEKTETPAFRKWFGESQVVNDDGSPKMVYHGSSAEFDEFSYEFIGKHGSAEGQGIYFTDSVQMASGYTDGYGGKLYAGWLKIENPLSNDKKTMTRAKLKKLISMIDTDGDGIISGYAKDTSDYGKPSFYQRELETTANAVYAGNANDAEMIAEIANGSGGMAYVAPYLRKLGYDGYVVKGKYTDATVYVAFESNQFKSVENAGTFSEETGNMYRSQKTDDANFFAGMYDDAEVRDAGKLIMRLERMRREKQFTTGDWKDETGKIAKKLLEETHSGMNQGALTRKINTMFRAMDQGNVTPNQLMEYAYGIAEKVAEGAGEEMQMDDGAQKARSYIRSHRIYLNDDMQSEVRAQYGDLRSFYSKHFGTAKFTTDRKATSLEDMWSELNEMHPGYFPADAHASEMPELLSKFLEVTGKVNRNYHGVNEQQLKQDVAMRLFWEYYKLPGTYGDQQAKMKEMVDQFGDMLDSLRESYQVRLKQSMDEFRHREEKQRQRNMLERSVKAMTKRLLKPTKNQHIPEEMRGAVASMLELVNTSGSKKGQEARTKAYAQLQAAIAELRKTDVGYAYVDPDMEAYLQELKEKSGNKSVMSMNLQELKDLNKVISGIRHACTVADQLLTAGHKGSVAAIADDARSALDSMKDRKVRSDLANMATRLGKYAMEDAPRFFRDMARYTGKAGKTLWDIVRHGGLDKQITLLKEAEEKLEEIRSKYKGYEQWMSRNSESKSFATESGEIELTTGQIMALYLLNKRKQARSHIYGIQGNDGGIAQKRVNTKNGARESVRPSKVNEAQVDYIIGTLTKEQKAFADEMSALLNGWCSDLGNEVSMLMYGYKKYTEKNYFPIEVWGGRKDATSGEERQNLLYLILNKAFTKEVQDKAQAPLVVPDMFDAVTEHINGMIVYNAWSAPVTDMIKFINHKFRDDSVTMDQNGMEVFAPGQNIIGTVKEDLSRVMGEGAERWYVQLIEDINGLAKNKVEKDVTGFVNKLTRNFKATAVGYNIGTMLKQPTSVIRAFDVIPPLYFAGKPVVPNKERQAIMEKYAPIVTWKGYGNFTMDTGKSIERILFPESSTKMERFNEWGMAGAGYMDTVTWHNIWAAAERMATKQNKDLQRGTDAFYKKTAEIFNQCIDQTQTVDSILHRTQLMRQDTAWIKSVTTFMGEPMKSYNMLMDAVNAWKTQNSKERARTVSKAAGIFAVNAATAAFVNSLISALRNWDDEDPFWQQVWQKMFGQYDEDMTTSEKFMEAIFGSNLAGELNILNYIPIARDIVETFAGYDVERVDMSLFADVRDAVEALKSEKTATPEKIMDLVGALANFVGIPVNNVMMESKRIWNWYNRQMEAFGLDTLDSQYAFLRAQKNIGASGNLTDYANLLLKAEAEGRTDLVKKIRQDMLEAGAEADNIDSKLYKLQVEDLTGIKNASYEKTYAALGAAMKAGDKNLQAALTKELKRAGRTDEQIESGLVNWLKEDPRVISAAQKAVNGNTNEKTQLVKTLRAEGYSDAVAKKAINQLQNKLVSDAKKANTKAEEKPKEPEYEALYTNYDLQTAIENGSDVDDILEDLRKQGREDSSIKSSITSAIKPVYIALMNGTASDKAQAKKIKERLLQLDLKVKYDGKTIDGWLKEDTKK